MKPEFQALRKFAQGAYIPPKTTSNDERRTNISTHNENHRNVLCNNTKVKTLLDIISLHQLHKHKEGQIEWVCAKVPHGSQPRQSLCHSSQHTFVEQSKLPICSHLTELAFSNSSNDQQVGLAAHDKPKFQAQRKFAQGAYIPQSDVRRVERRKRFASDSDNEQCRKFLENNMEVKRLLDVISLRQFHRHKDHWLYSTE